VKESCPGAHDLQLTVSFKSAAIPLGRGHGTSSILMVNSMEAKESPWLAAATKELLAKT
jgi:hypothetical protein